MIDESSDRSARARLLRGAFRLALGLLAAAAVAALLARAIIVYRSDGALDEMIAELDREDPDWRWEGIEAKRAEVPDAQNSALVVRGIVSRRINDLARPMPAAPDGAAPHGRIKGDLNDLIPGLPPEARPAPPLARALELGLAERGPALAEALKLADMPVGRHPLQVAPDFVSTIRGSEQFTQHVAGLLALEAARRAEANDPAGALACVRAALNAGRSLGDEPLAMSMLYRLGCSLQAIAALERVLAQGRPGAADLAVIQRALADEAAAPRVLYGLRGERAGMIKLCDALDNGWVELSEVMGQEADDAPPNFLGPIVARRTRAELLRLYTDMIDAVRRPPHEWDDALKPIRDRIRSGSPLARKAMGISLYLPEKELRGQAVLRAATAAVAAERFRLARGRWPSDAQELVGAGLLAAVPPDPYTGDPFRLQRTPYGLAVYSLGPDRADDGGRPVNWSPQPPEGDIVFRLFDPSCRRLTAEPLPMPRESP